MHFPKARLWPVFICECCTVRAHVQRELTKPSDKVLLRLERVRVLDVANSWSAGTHKVYGPKLMAIRHFEQQHPGVSILADPHLEAPPTSPSIPLAWVEAATSIRKSNMPTRDTVAYGTIRQLRSAVGWHHTVAALVSAAGEVTYDERTKRLISNEGLSVQDAAITRYTKGLRERIGDNPEPSWALLDRHVRAFDAYFDRQYRSSTSRQAKHRWALAGMANLKFWLAWLRSREVFDQRWMDVEGIRPDKGPIHDLPPNVGALLLKLDPQTKTNRDSTADVPVAWSTRSGYFLGRWYQRACSTHPLGGGRSQDPSYIYVEPDGTRWDSHFFRNTFIYPLLYKLMREGDPYLRPFRENARMSIAHKFHSLHMYRRGGRSHVDLLRAPTYGRRKATVVEIYEHGRWRRSRTSEPIDVIYRAWTLYDRLQITLYCDRI